MKVARTIGRFLRGTSGASAVAQIALTNGLVLCVNVLTGVVTARFLGPQGRGEFATITLVMDKARPILRGEDKVMLRADIAAASPGTRSSSACSQGRAAGSFFTGRVSRRSKRRRCRSNIS